MFEVDKPRRFHYEPRFYNPEKERWEALKKKYADEQERAEARAAAASEDGSDEELAYFEQKVRDLDKKGQESFHLGWRDLFRKREMPKYNPQFHTHATGSTANAAADSESTATAEESLAEKYRTSKRKIKIRRRFDIGDEDYMKPASPGKIFLYALIVLMLLYLILGV